MAKTNDEVRYQILAAGKSEFKTENFTAKQHAQFLKRQAALKKLGIQFSTWDTRKNPLSELFPL